MMGEGASNRWRRVEELLAAALELDPSARDRFLDTACAGDPELQREVASLLAAHERSGPMDRLGADLAPLAERVRGAAANATTTQEGRVVGRYRVLEQIGGGGMGVVFKALDTKLDRSVALKFLQPRFGVDDSAAERFRLEARTVAALEHPNICTVHEIGETDDGQLYLAMPLYDGETLQRRIARGPLPVEDAVGIAMQIARGLAKAHGRGVTHRDIKPSNVLVTSDGVVKVLDFGIAKLVDVTLTGTAAGPLGTVAYMSPEQARGAAVDHRTDLWSLGVVLYEMITGSHPFASGEAGAAWHAIQHAEPAPPSTVRSGIPPALDRVVATALRKSPDERYQTAQAFEGDLLALGLGSGASAGLGAPSAGATRVAAGREPADAAARPAGARARAAKGAVAITAVAAIAAFVWFGPVRGRSAPADTAPATVAVLPFADRSEGSDQEYFADGITDELIATLARVEGLRVASRTSSFAFKNRDVDVRTVGAQLKVATVLEGSVRRAGDQLRITAQLVNVADDAPLWSDTYDRSAGDAFAVQQEIAAAIARALRVELVGIAGDSSGRPRPDTVAFDLYLRGRQALYLRGRYAWYSRTEEGLRTAASFFEQAVAQDSTYAQAFSGLADAYAVLGFYDFLPPDEAFPKADSAARRAIAIDPVLAAPRATRGYVELYYNWDLRRGEEEFQRAIALQPEYSTAHQWYANLLTAAGRFAEAEAEMRRATELDPLSLIANAALGWVLYHAGDYARAAEQCSETLELNPEYALAHLWRGWALQELDSLPAAIEAHRRAVANADSGDVFVASLARSLALAGETAEARRLLRRLESRGARGGYVPSYEIARVHVALGQPDEAITRLERAFSQRSHSMVFLRVDPQLAPLRTDPRFERLVRRVFPS